MIGEGKREEGRRVWKGKGRRGLGRTEKEEKEG